MNRSRTNILYISGVFIGAGLFFLGEQFFGSKLGIWWGLLGGGMVFEFLFILGSRFLGGQGGEQRQAKLIQGFWGFVTVAAKLSWEIFYIFIGIKYLASPWGLGLGGLLALGWYYYCLKGLKEN